MRPVSAAAADCVSAQVSIKASRTTGVVRFPLIPLSVTDRGKFCYLLSPGSFDNRARQPMTEAALHTTTGDGRR